MAFGGSMDAPAVFVVIRCMQAGENDIIVNDYDKSSKSSYIGVGFSNSSMMMQTVQGDL